VFGSGFRRAVIGAPPAPTPLAIRARKLSSVCNSIVTNPIHWKRILVLNEN
jgi:hypothetical protein